MNFLYKIYARLFTTSLPLRYTDINKAIRGGSKYPIKYTKVNGEYYYLVVEEYDFEYIATITTSNSDYTTITKHDMDSHNAYQEWMDEVIDVWNVLISN